MHLLNKEFLNCTYCDIQNNYYILKLWNTLFLVEFENLGYSIKLHNISTLHIKYTQKISLCTNKDLGDNFIEITRFNGATVLSHKKSLFLWNWLI